MPKPSNRDRILDAGLKVMYRKGYGGAGVRDIVAEAPAPQGSFTNHFRSKEEFAREVLDLYFEGLKRLVAETLGDAASSPRERLRRYLDIITDRLASGLQELGFTPLGPTAGPNASGIVTVSRPGTDIETLFERLTAANIICSFRQDRQGRHYIRFSPHFYNTEAEVDRVLKAIEQ